jgi:rod shape-determining protein MreD
MIDRAQRPWVIAVSFVIAFMLTATPLPDWALPWRPAWIAMVLVYWCMALPARVGVLTGWIALLYHQRVRVYPLVQQALFVSSVVFLYLALMLWAYNLLGSVEYGADYLMGALTTGLLWPWVFVVLRDVRRRARVA